MMSFFEDTDFARSNLANISSYLVSLLDAWKPNCMVCSILSLVEALSYNPTQAPAWREASSTLRIHQSALLWSVSDWGSYTKKSANTCPFNAKRDLYWIPNSLSSIAHPAILHDKSGLCMVLCKGRLVSMTMGCAWK